MSKVWSEKKSTTLLLTRPDTKASTRSYGSSRGGDRGAGKKSSSNENVDVQKLATLAFHYFLCTCLNVAALFFGLIKKTYLARHWKARSLNYIL